MRLETEKTVLAVVVTYNRSHMLDGALHALQSQSVPCDILIVDNASTDQTEAVVRPYLGEQVDYLRLEKNLGGAGGFNIGMKLGVQRGYQYLWIMDDDAYPEPTALEELLLAAGKVDNQFGFLCSTVLWTDGKECRMNRQKLHSEYAKHIELLQHGLLAVSQATFVSCFFQAETVKEAGLPITDFFIWGDDIEYTHRLSIRQKRPCYLVGKSIVVHHMTQNTGSDISTDEPGRLGRYRYAYRNENYLYRKEGIKGIAYYCARCGLHMFRIWTKARNCRCKRSWVLISSFFKGWFFNPEIEYVTEVHTDEI